MPKLNSLEQLESLINELKENENKNKIVLKVALGTCGISAGADETYDELIKEIEKEKLENIEVIKTGCLGYCYAEPTVEINEPGKKPVLYGNVTRSKVKDLVKTHLVEGKVAEELIIKETHKNAI
ncbi:MAG: (2Fe-2S) ferredoxin domain-containing protein [Thermotogota bacterium]|nr:(2Fe-2S) ferredoxin domain-containing protein [Thermotogota bacterium]